MQVEELQASEATELDDCPPIPLGNIDEASLTLEAVFASGDSESGEGITALIFSSPDGLEYDTEPIKVFALSPKAGAPVRKTVELPTSVRFVKVVLRAAEDSGGASDIKVTATLSG